MKINKKIISRRKGQFNVWTSNSTFERVQLFYHANTLVPLRDTLHFGIKPGHFFVYTKKWNEKGNWIVNDAGYVNYFRVDQLNVIQTDYNTLSKQKLMSRGILTHKIGDTFIDVSSYSLFPLHKRKVTLDMDKNEIRVKDNFLWKTDVFFNTPNGLEVDKSYWNNERTIALS